MNQEISVQPGCTVVLHYRITLEDGTVADNNFDEDPIRFAIGDGTLHEGMELALLGQPAGTHETIKIGPEIAFGFPDDEAIVKIPKTDFPADMQLVVGSVVDFLTPAGDQIFGIVIEDLDDTYLVDCNHPLAGHEFDFEYELLEVNCPD